MERRRDSSGDAEEDELQCACVLSVEAIHRATQAPRSVPLSASTAARIFSRSRRKKRKAGGVLEVLEGGAAADR